MVFAAIGCLISWLVYLASFGLLDCYVRVALCSVLMVIRWWLLVLP